MSPRPARTTRVPRFRWTASAVFATAVAAALSAGCAPAYDWREIRVDDDHYRAMMPGKPDRMSLPIDLDGIQVPMTMRGVRVGAVAFTVAAATLPEDSPVLRERAIAAMRSSMVRNIAGRELVSEALAVPVVDAGGRAAGSAPGWRIEASGRAADREVGMHAVFAARGGRAWQAVVLGPSPDREQTRVFLDGFRITD